MGFLIKKIKYLSLRRFTGRLILSISVTGSVIFSFLVLINYQITKHSFIQKNDSQIKSSSGIVNYLIDSKIQDINQLLKKEASSYELTENKTTQDQLRRILKYENLFAVEIINSKNKNAVSTDKEFTEPKNKFETEIMGWALQMKQLPAQFIIKNENLYIFASRRTMSGDILNLWFALSNQWAAEVSFLVNAEIFIVIDKKVVASSSKYVSGNLSQIKTVKDFSLNSKTFDIDIYSTTYRVNEIPIRNTKQDIFANLLVGSDLHHLDNILQEMINKYVIVFIVSNFIIAAVVIFITSFQVSSWQKLVDTADLITRIGPESFQEIPVLSSDMEEIKTLSISINGMLKALSLRLQNVTEAKKEVDNLNQQLETRIQEKTKELEKSMAILIQSDKFVALGRMAGGVAHEINNPLMIIQAYAERAQDLIESGIFDKDKLLKATETIQNTVTRISKVIIGLRSISRDGKNDPFTPIPVARLIEESLALCHERFLSKNIDVSTNEIPKDLTISCRATQVQQVLINLLNNAIDAISGYEKKWVTIEVKDQNNFIEIYVTDCGVGIPKEIIKNIFTPFFTTKEVGSGVGLGLSISKELIESHKGNLYIDESHPHTRFVIQLPKEPSRA